MATEQEEDETRESDEEDAVAGKERAQGGKVDYSTSEHVHALVHVGERCFGTIDDSQLVMSSLWPVSPSVV